MSSDDPEVLNLKEQAKSAIKGGRFAEAEDLLAQARACDREAEVVLEKSIGAQKAALEKRKLSRSASCVDQAKLQRLQYRYEKAAEYWQEAAVALPEGSNKKRANCLVNAGYDLKHLGQYNDALPLYEQSLELFRKVNYKQGEGMVLNNMSQVYDAWGNYDTALTYLQQSLIIQQKINDNYGEITSLNNISAIYWKQSDFSSALERLEAILPIRRSIKDRAGEAMTLNNISQIYKAQGKYEIALEYLNSALLIHQDIGDKYGEVATLNNISQVHKAQKDFLTALKYSEQSLATAEEIGTKPEIATLSSNIGRIYEDQGELAKAELYFSSAVNLMGQLEYPKLEEWRKALKVVRAKLQEQR
ncbi:MAG: hypothetical protein D3910_14245 [Candidatus Electrothrix sp. ATG2]|nr:hypothetical protein [Candidatus Electrothrix sp. ATG2]